MATQNYVEVTESVCIDAGRKRKIRVSAISNSQRLPPPNR